MDYNLSANLTRRHEGAWDPSTKTDGPHARHRSEMAARLADLAGTIRDWDLPISYGNIRIQEAYFGSRMAHGGR